MTLDDQSDGATVKVLLYQRPSTATAAPTEACSSATTYPPTAQAPPSAGYGSGAAVVAPITTTTT